MSNRNNQQLTATACDPEASLANRTPVIRAEGVTRRYCLGKDNFVDALRGASALIWGGEMVAVMGPSGSGKSTLLHVLGCLDQADSGEVWVNGRRVDRFKERALAQLRRGEIGFIFQGFNLVSSLSAVDNVALAAEYAGRSRKEALVLAREALRQVDLTDRAKHRPGELSGGQQQRVAIARALVNTPNVIMGDEPTGNLDSLNSADVMAMMRDINSSTGTTFVLVIHDPEVAATCDRVIRMHDGLVVDDGEPHTSVRNGDKTATPARWAHTTATQDLEEEMLRPAV